MNQHHTPSGPHATRLLGRVLRRLAGRSALSSVAARVDDSPGWSQSSVTASNERCLAEVQEQYQDALTAWRKNPMAKRIVDITTDFCLGDGLTPSAPGQLGAWINRFWTHPKNAMATRMPELSDELCRAGDLFLTLHRNPDDGLSYVRPIPKDRIIAIETLPNDWETEVAYTEARSGSGTVTWLGTSHPEAAGSPAVMLHYRVNGVVGALLGESDLGPVIPWLLRYSRMLEDRVRLNWALKAFLWIVTVPTNAVQAKREQYATPPEGGSIIVKDAQEEWAAQCPNLHAFDARYDLAAVRTMIHAGAAFPPHWFGDPTDVNLATATAMERAAARHLRRRQLYLRHMAIDLVHTAVTRAWEIGRIHPRPNRDAISCDTTDLSRQDNRDLANAALAMAQAMQTLVRTLGGTSGEIKRKAVELVLRFGGEPLEPADLDALLRDLSPVPGAEAPAERRSPQ